MLQVIAHGDVTELRFTTLTSRLVGMRCSAFVVRGVLIDSGFPDASRDLLAWIDAHPVRGAIITHYHEDHAGGVTALAERGVPVWMSDATAPKVLRPAPVNFYRRFSWGRPRASSPHAAFAPPPELRIIATPGHTADHHAVWDAETRSCFGGDLFIGVKVRIAHATEDARVTSASLRKVIALGPSRFFDAHRGVMPNPVPLLTAKADWLDATAAQAEALMAQGLSDAQIARQLLGNDWFERWFSQGDYTMENWVRGLRAGAARRAMDAR